MPFSRAQVDTAFWFAVAAMQAEENTAVTLGTANGNGKTIVLTADSAVEQALASHLDVQRGKITLEQYIQAAGFDGIIAAANRRLLPMSDGQYELYRQEDSLGKKSNIAKYTH